VVRLKPFRPRAASKLRLVLNPPGLFQQSTTISSSMISFSDLATHDEQALSAFYWQFRGLMSANKVLGQQYNKWFVLSHSVRGWLQNIQVAKYSIVHSKYPIVSW